jgi:hypothetical protein
MRRFEDAHLHANEWLHLQPLAHVLAAVTAVEGILWLWLGLWHIGEVGLHLCFFDEDVTL